ncbi:MAG: TetR/AcrR family transcriptional regulator [Mycoplasmoidaceae bacterium]|nr:TetR/AcrR family transcriptional regulator [Mycoplasmoidaceae bacterium]
MKLLEYEDNDLRIIKTDNALTYALFDALKENVKIKVLNLCKRADVTAMTYYRHFGNKYQLYTFAIKKQLQAFLPIPKKLKPSTMRQLVYYLLVNTQKFIFDSKDVILQSLSKIDKKGIDQSYIGMMFSIYRYYVHQEIKLICGKASSLETSMWANLLSGAIVILFMNQLKCAINVNSKLI